MTKIVYNSCYGDFGLSAEAVRRYAEIKDLELLVIGNERFAAYYTRMKGAQVVAPGDIREATQEALEALGFVYFCASDLSRSDPALVQAVEELGERANGFCADLAITEIPAGTRYRIEEYDGLESIIAEGSQDWFVA